jgi:hypothetical protein
MCSIKKDYDGQRFSGDTEIKSFRSSQGIELWYLYNTMYSESHVYCHGYISNQRPILISMAVSHFIFSFIRNLARLVYDLKMWTHSDEIVQSHVVDYNLSL